MILDYPPRSYINPSHFRKINQFPVSDRVEYCIANTVLSTGMELYQDIFLKCLNLHSVAIAQDRRWHWTYLCRKQIQGKKAYPFQGQKYGPKQALVPKMLEHCLLLSMLLRKIFYFICKSNSSYYHFLMTDIII